MINFITFKELIHINMRRINKILSLALKERTAELSGRSSDNNISNLSNISEVSSELNEEQKEAAESLEDLITLSDLGITSNDKHDKVDDLLSALDNIESPGPSYNLEQTEPADFDSDDSLRDQTFNPGLEQSSSDDDSSISSEDEVHQENTNNNDVVLNTTRKRKGKNLRKTIQVKRNKGQSYKTKKGKIIPARKVTALSDCRKKCASKISLEIQTTLFDELWALGNYNKRTAYLSFLILDAPKKTQRIRNTGVIQFKTSLYSTEFKNISFCRRGKANEPLNPQKYYDKPLPVSQEKKKDLLSILHLIDSDCHEFYRKLDTDLNSHDVDPDLEEFNDL